MTEDNPARWLPADAARRAIVVVALIAGPALVAGSYLFVVHPTGSMRGDFAAMAAQPWKLVVQPLLEVAGFTLTLGAYAAVSRCLRTRGAALGTWGGVACIVGVAGFGLSNAQGFTLHALASLPDADAAFTAAVAIPGAAPGAVIMAMTVVGEVGMCLVMGGLMRARVVPVWPLVALVLGIVAITVLGSITASVIADLLLLLASTWVAVALARAPQAVWLGAAALRPFPAVRARVAA